MRVVPGIADDRRALVVPQEVVTATAEQELGRILALEQVGMPDRAVPVEALEIDLRRSRVAQPARVNVPPDHGSIGRDVVRDELPEEGPPRRILTERRLVVLLIAAVAQSPRIPERQQELIVGREGGELREQPSIRRRRSRPVHMSPAPRGGEAMSVLHGAILREASGRHAPRSGEAHPGTLAPWHLDKITPCQSKPSPRPDSKTLSPPRRPSAISMATEACWPTTGTTSTISPAERRSRRSVTCCGMGGCPAAPSWV